MDLNLPEWYGHSDDTITAILQTGTIALDANVMLDLYRVGHGQREQILDVLQKVKERLFIPYQAALEFQRNRLEVAFKMQQLVKTLPERLRIKDSDLSDIRDPILKADIQRLADEAAAKFEGEVTRLWEDHMVAYDDVRRSDPVRDALDALLSADSVGDPPAQKEIEERSKTALQRFEDRIPPGYMDASKDPLKAVGDYLIWRELLDHFGTADRPLLFVSRDEKEDWYTIVRGQKIGPRPELRSEMRIASSAHPYHHMNLASFLALANKHLGAKVDETTIETVETMTREANESERKRLPPEVLDQARRSFKEVLAKDPEFTKKLLETFQADLPPGLSDKFWLIASPRISEKYKFEPPRGLFESYQFDPPPGLFDTKWIDPPAQDTPDPGDDTDQAD
ncbi:PIN-like domain-containing protein [Mycolicibacterium helvum]|uniref:PIN like domain-containing protein n=1 Tax=Mycolicibacterium helvum TaxID=1534349 RepID=A0A7I7T1Z4_9MYCO|nr:PIN domain-containing protein [Mycolicibacterium helvum]BBY62096.1 hypothetical protein MHEL_03390 [Mycolicibacterium helvum]